MAVFSPGCSIIRLEYIVRKLEQVSPARTILVLVSIFQVLLLSRVSLVVVPRDRRTIERLDHQPNFDMFSIVLLGLMILWRD